MKEKMSLEEATMKALEGKLNERSGTEDNRIAKIVDFHVNEIHAAKTKDEMIKAVARTWHDEELDDIDYQWIMYEVILPKVEEYFKVPVSDMVESGECLTASKYILDNFSRMLNSDEIDELKQDISKI